LCTPRAFWVDPTALRIRHPEADRLVRRLAEATGKSLTEVVIEALRDKWEQEQRRAAFPRLSDEIMTISRRAGALPRRTGHSADDILGYDERGLPR
jgi:antitoxin VapB